MDDVTAYRIILTHIALTTSDPDTQYFIWRVLDGSAHLPVETLKRAHTELRHIDGALKK